MNIRQLKIAEKSLASCITDGGIVAGGHHFVDLWARDSLFATFGANVSGMISESKNYRNILFFSARRWAYPVFNFAKPSHYR